jgi:hypothetical protein
VAVETGATIAGERKRKRGREETEKRTMFLGKG